MSSILTNNSAMVALQTLKSINTNLSKTMEEISTGKAVGSARDNAAVWAISKVMEADVAGFGTISESLSLGSSTVSVARQAAETVTDLLTQMKEKIVSAQEDNVDRAKIQTDVDALVEQIEAVVGAAQFNGLNLVNGTAGASIDVLASLDRDISGNVSVSNITVDTQDLSTGNYTANAVLTGSTGVSTNEDAAAFALNSGGGTGNIVIAAGAVFAEGDSISITIGDQTATYTVTAEDVAATTTSDIVAVGLKSAVESLGIAGLTVDYDSVTPGQLTFTNSGTVDLTVAAQYENAGSGGLGLLSTIDVTTEANAATALANIEGMLETSIDAAAALGSAQQRIDTQANFISKLSDALKAGIGSLVDADMEEASARLTALQTQQQLGIQSLSIANQAPQNILSLFR